MRRQTLYFLLLLSLIFPATLLSAGEAHAQRVLHESREGGRRSHKVSERRGQSHHRPKAHRPSHSRPSHGHRPNRPTTVHRSNHVHRHHVTHHRYGSSYRYGTRYVSGPRYGRYSNNWGYRYVSRPRYYAWGPTHVVHHHHRPVVIHVEDVEPDLPELECSPRTEMRQTDRETWCATDRGHRHGPYVRYHQNGEVAEEGWYEYGTKEGVWMTYHTNGALKSEGAFAGNSRVGVWTNYNQRGDEISSTEYR